MANKLTTFTELLPNMLTTGTSIFQSQQAINTQIQGGLIQSQAYRNSGNQARAIANYNIQLNKIDLNRKMSDLNRNVQRAIGKQRSQAVATGFAGTSKSFLAVMNETLDGFDQAATLAQTNFNIKSDQIRFQAEQHRVDSENRARAAEFESQVAAFKTGQKQAGQITGLATMVGQGLTDLVKKPPNSSSLLG